MKDRYRSQESVEEENEEGNELVASIKKLFKKISKNGANKLSGI